MFHEVGRLLTRTAASCLGFYASEDSGAAGVVTEDVTDGHRLSMATACERLGLAWVRTRGFLEGCGIPVKSEGGAG